MGIKPPPPDIVIGRLPIYLRALDALSRNEQEITSSYELGKLLGISSAQIRKDLSHFGDFGKQGTGYQISYLTEQLRQILKVNREWAFVIMGAGLLGRALANYNGFGDHGFKPVAIFDVDQGKIGTKINNFTVQHINESPEVIQEHRVRIAMITTPASAAQEIADMVIEAGVQSILSYAPITLNVPDSIHVQYIDPVSKLQHMTYYIDEN